MTACGGVAFAGLGDAGADDGLEGARAGHGRVLPWPHDPQPPPAGRATGSPLIESGPRRGPLCLDRSPAGGGQVEVRRRPAPLDTVAEAARRRQAIAEARRARGSATPRARASSFRRTAGRRRSRSVSFPTQRDVASSDRASAGRQVARRGVERQVAVAHRAQRPAHALLHEVPFVAGRPLDERQAVEKRLVVGLLVVECQARQQRERRALHELLAPAAPLPHLAPGVRRPIEQVEAERCRRSPSCRSRGTSGPSAPAVTRAGSPTKATSAGLVPRRCPTTPRPARDCGRASGQRASSPSTRRRPSRDGWRSGPCRRGCAWSRGASAR